MADLKLLEAVPSAEEREAIDAIVGPAPAYDGRTARAIRDKRHLLLPALRAAQRRVGWVSEGALGYASRRLSVPPAEAYGVATFYALLSLEERPADVTHVCTDLACALNGASAGPGEHASPCLGLCDRAPAKYRTVAGPEPFEEQIPAESPLPTGPRLLRRFGIDPTSLDAYVAAGGFEMLARARELGAEAVVARVTESKLLGRGGAAFPTGVKWDAVRKQPAQPHYVVCNADESEPGTFKDRVLMEGDPFGLVESLAIAGFACGAQKGFVYIRAEYPLAHARVQHAIEASAPYLDGFEIELRIGAGAYICGEETALFQSIEGKRGEPRNKPPFPVEVGLFGKPTAVNNVETLFNVPEILRGESAETRLFCVSGNVERPGVYELPLGVTLRELLETAGAPSVKAVLLGGAAGAFVGPDMLDLELTHEATRAAGLTLGSGVVMVFDEQADLAAAVLRIAEFFRDESCGQCVPCRVGTVRQQEALQRLAAGRPRQDELQTLAELAQVMRDASICGLGQTAANAVASAIVNLGVFAA
ncbi:MAG TPA: NADH-ubiquinone oxidoreductase-F iron-sulfur binding region domain-containing protein [Gaiellaceae bacterium]